MTPSFGHCPTFNVALYLSVCTTIFHDKMVCTACKQIESVCSLAPCQTTEPGEVTPSPWWRSALKPSAVPCRKLPCGVHLLRVANFLFTSIGAVPAYYSHSAENVVFAGCFRFLGSSAIFGNETLSIASRVMQKVHSTSHVLCNKVHSMFSSYAVATRGFGCCSASVCKLSPGLFVY